MDEDLPGPRTDTTPRVLDAPTARAARIAHEARAEALTAAHRARRARGEKHQVEDFLFTYYPFSPARLRRWHPGAGISYDAAADPVPDHAPHGDLQPDGTRSWYLDTPDEQRVLRRADVRRYLAERGDALAFVHRLLDRSTLAHRTPQFGCFGLHEWAMVHGLAPGARRHEDLPLRLSQRETDEVIERERLVCSHLDAYRFFTPTARPRNALEPTRARQAELDNPACLHVGMDLYKWSMKLTPIVSSDLVLDCFEHARRTRVLDMEASPYDVTHLGHGVVPIETPAGKAEYVRRQRALAADADALRRRILVQLVPFGVGARGRADCDVVPPA